MIATGADGAPARDAISKVALVVARIKSGVLVVAAVAVGLISWFTIGRLAAIDEVERPGGFVGWCLAHPAAVPSITIVAAACGITGLLVRRRAWIWLTLGTIALVAVFVTVLTVFLGVIAPLYEVG